MATVHIALGRLRISGIGAVAGLAGPAPIASEEITTDGTNKQSAVAAISNDGAHFWRVTATGGNVMVAIGPDPDAVTGPAWKVLDGRTEEFAAQNGDRVAVTNE